MKKSRAILVGPFIFSILGIIFCVWSALGNEVNFCVTAGCTLYQDFNIGGLSMWWIGTGAFTLLAACALFGQADSGRVLGAVFLTGDICLLVLMAFTAPCVSCLVVAFLFALCYWFFRRHATLPSSASAFSSSCLLLVWLAFFIINVGQAARSQIDIWPILDESGEARGRMFFSPSCRFCIEGINLLAGNVRMAFYPVAENDEDVFRILKIRELLAEGDNLAEAIVKSENTPVPGFFASLFPDILLLKFRLLCNKAHVFAAGSRGVPFFEYLGLPPEIRKRIEEPDSSSQLTLPEKTPKTGNAALPPELLDGQCTGNEPCPPATP